MDRVIRLGILAPGGIFYRMIVDFCKARGLVVTAVGSRSLERAQKAAAHCGAKYAFGSYEELAACDEVDLVYVASPHSHHMEHAELCMNHGKHVVCEKSLAVNDQQVRHMAACARKNNVFLMEAMWSRFFPASYKLREILASGELGEIRHVTANFSFNAQPEETHRLVNPALAGGALLDVGVYAMEAVTMVLGYEPAAVQGLHTKIGTGVDGQNSIQFQYPSGATAQMFTGFCANAESRQMIYGTKGRIEIPDFWHPTHFTRFNDDGSTVEYRFPAENEGHHHEFVHARECILQGLAESPIIPLKESEAVARIATNLRRQWGVLYPGEE